MKKYTLLATAVVLTSLFCWTTVFAQGACIDFETMADTTLITTQFNVAPWWVTFSLPNAPGTGPYSAQVGPPITAFAALSVNSPCLGGGASGSDAIRVADQGLIGCTFLTDTQSQLDPGQTLRIDYSQNFPTQVSGHLLDIDNTEAWQIRAYGPDLVTLVNPGPGPNPVTISTTSPFPAGAEGGAVPWQINLSLPIHRIEFVYVGGGSAVGIGFDNFCPTSLPCITIANDSLECDPLGSGDVTYSFDFTNLSGVEVHHLILTPPPGITVTPNVFSFPGLLSAPVSAGETVAGLQATIGGAAAGGSPVNFRVSLHDSLISECCSIDHPLTIEPCCMTIPTDSLACVGGGDFDYTFQFQNLSSETIHHVYVLGGFPATFTPNHFLLVTPIAPGGTGGPFTTTVSGVSPLSPVSFRIAIHDSLIQECCSIERTVTSPCSTAAAISNRTKESLELRQNHPNPFNPNTMLEFEVRDNQAWVNLSIYDVQGRLVATLVDGQRSAGQHKVPWHGVNDRGEAVASGIYFYSLRSPSGVITRKLVLLK